VDQRIVVVGTDGETDLRQGAPGRKMADSHVSYLTAYKTLRGDGDA
jgi:hypothetical protein